jgi:methylisocitrate lyase
MNRENKPANLNAPAKLRRTLSQNRIIVAPGVFNTIVAQLAQRVGFKALYFSGGGFANSMGLADLGLTTLTEVSEAVQTITSRVGTPLIVDADTGFGEAVNVTRTVSQMERAGAAAIHLEDQVMPKKCGHLPDKQLVTADEMVKKILAAVETRKNGLLLIARTDARAVEGMDKAIERARLYAKAGADIIFPEALESEEEFREFAKKVDTPLLANMTEFGKTPMIEASQFEKMGYKIVIFPMTALRVTLKAVEETFKELKASGSQKRIVGKMMTRQEIYELIDYYQHETLDKRLIIKAQKIIGRGSP